MADVQRAEESRRREIERDTRAPFSYSPIQISRFHSSTCVPRAQATHTQYINFRRSDSGECRAKESGFKKSGKTDVKGRSHPTSNRLRCFVSYTLFFAPPPLFEHLEQEIYGQAFQIFKTYHELFVKCVTKGFAHSIIHQRKGSHEKL